MYRFRHAGNKTPRRTRAGVPCFVVQCFIIGPHRAPAAGRKLVSVDLASPILYLPPCCHHDGGIRPPLWVVLCFRPFGLLNRGFPPKRANAVVAIVRVVPVHRAGGIDVADVVRIRRYKAYPKKSAAPSIGRRASPLSCDPLPVFLSPACRHPFYLDDVICPCFALIF